jgi:hypothetical protein
MDQLRLPPAKNIESRQNQRVLKLPTIGKEHITVDLLEQSDKFQSINLSSPMGITLQPALHQKPIIHYFTSNISYDILPMHDI